MAYENELGLIAQKKQEIAQAEASYAKARESIPGYVRSQLNRIRPTSVQQLEAKQRAGAEATARIRSNLSSQESKFKEQVTPVKEQLAKTETAINQYNAELAEIERAKEKAKVAQNYSQRGEFPIGESGSIQEGYSSGTSVEEYNKLKAQAEYENLRTAQLATKYNLPLTDKTANVTVEQINKNLEAENAATKAELVKALEKGQILRIAPEGVYIEGKINTPVVGLQQIPKPSDPNIVLPYQSRGTYVGINPPVTQLTPGAKELVADPFGTILRRGPEEGAKAIAATAHFLGVEKPLIITTRKEEMNLPLPKSWRHETINANPFAGESVTLPKASIVVSPYTVAKTGLTAGMLLTIPGEVIMTGSALTSPGLKPIERALLATPTLFRAARPIARVAKDSLSTSVKVEEVEIFAPKVKQITVRELQPTQRTFQNGMIKSEYPTSAMTVSTNELEQVGKYAIVTKVNPLQKVVNWVRQDLEPKTGDQIILNGPRGRYNEAKEWLTNSYEQETRSQLTKAQIEDLLRLKRPSIPSMDFKGTTLVIEGLPPGVPNIFMKGTATVKPVVMFSESGVKSRQFESYGFMVNQPAKYLKTVKGKEYYESTPSLEKFYIGNAGAYQKFRQAGKTTEQFMDISEVTPKNKVPFVFTTESNGMTFSKEFPSEVLSDKTISKRTVPKSKKTVFSESNLIEVDTGRKPVDIYLDTVEVKSENPVNPVTSKSNPLDVLSTSEKLNLVKEIRPQPSETVLTPVSDSLPLLTDIPIPKYGMKALNIPKNVVGRELLRIGSKASIVFKDVADTVKTKLATSLESKPAQVLEIKPKPVIVESQPGSMYYGQGAYERSEFSINPISPLSKETVGITNISAQKGLQLNKLVGKIKTNDKLGLKLSESNIQTPTERQGLNIKSALNTRIASAEMTRVDSKLSTLQKLQSKLQSRTRQENKIKNPPRTTTNPRIRPSITTAPKSDNNLIKKLSSKLYKVSTWKGGKEVVIGKNLPKGKATKLGVETALSTLRASFKLTPTSEGNVQDINYKMPGRIFTTAKRDSNRFVQLPKYRLSARSEVSEIMSAKRRSKIWA